MCPSQTLVRTALLGVFLLLAGACNNSTAGPSSVEGGGDLQARDSESEEQTEVAAAMDTSSSTVTVVGRATPYSNEPLWIESGEGCRWIFTPRLEDVRISFLKFIDASPPGKAEVGVTGDLAGGFQWEIAGDNPGRTPPELRVDVYYLWKVSDPWELQMGTVCGMGDYYFPLGHPSPLALELAGGDGVVCSGRQYRNLETHGSLDFNDGVYRESSDGGFSKKDLPAIVRRRTDSLP